LAETEKYIDRMTEADDRFELYMELSLYRKAADCAIRMKDAARLQEVKP
jgi:Vps16, C-terminal region